MRKSFSAIDKQFLRRIVWLLILALFSVLIFWQQTRAEAVESWRSVREGASLSVKQGLSGRSASFPLPIRTHDIHPTFHIKCSSDRLGPNLEGKR